MKRILMLFVSFYATSVISQNVNYSQLLTDMLMRDECFQAWDYRHQYSDSIAKETELIYNYKMNGFLNRPDSSAIYLERIFDECPAIMPDEVTKLAFLNFLIALYNDTENYEKLTKVYDRAEQLLLIAPIGGDNNWKKEQLVLLNKYRSEAKDKLKNHKRSVFRYGDGHDIIDINKEPLVSVVVDYNGIPQRSWIDTGADGYLFMNNIFAERCRLKEIPQQSDSMLINGIMTRASLALVDSIKMGSLLFVNIPTIVVYDKFLSIPQSVSKADSLFKLPDVIIGYKLLKMLGMIEFDWENSQMCMKLRSEIPVTGEKPNICSLNGALYANMLINTVEYVGLLDMGARQVCISLDPIFYENNRNDISVDYQRKEKSKFMYGFSMNYVDEKYRQVITPNVVFDSKRLKLEDDDVIVWLENHSEQWKDGLIGYPFVKRLGTKVRFDFVNMRITAE